MRVSRTCSQAACVGLPLHRNRLHVLREERRVHLSIGPHVSSMTPFAVLRCVDPGTFDDAQRFRCDGKDPCLRPSPSESNVSCVASDGVLDTVRR